jgi:hypothetical protein
MSDPKEFVAALGERVNQTKEMIRMLLALDGIGAPNTDTQLKLAITEILSNQMAALNGLRVLTAMVDKTMLKTFENERRIDALEKWNQGRLKPGPYTRASQQVPGDGRSEVPEVPEP